MQLTVKTNFNGGNNMLIKGIVVGMLILVMLIPGTLVSDLVSERQGRQADVVKEVTDKWAGNQVVTGPVLMLPYKQQITLADNKVATVTKAAYILPDELNIQSNITPKEKKRSLYSVMLYQSESRLSGKFNMLPLEALQIDPETVVWKDARLLMSVSDERGINDHVVLEWNGKQQLLEAGVPENTVLKSGISSQVEVDATGQVTFAIKLSLRGSGQLYYTPVGKITETQISADWKDPAFDGKFLPVSSEIGDGKFTARWKVLPLSRAYPQYWKEGTQNLEKAAFGVRLIQAVDGYSKTHRSVKYAMLFVALTFAFFYFLEGIHKLRIHPVQYLLVGIALIIFYTLLLSLSEYTGFNAAYGIAALATITLVATYVGGLFKNTRIVAGFTIALTALYTYIFLIIQSEDYALLFGSIGLFGIMAVIMYFSRKVDWYAVSRQTENTGNDTAGERMVPATE